MRMDQTDNRVELRGMVAELPVFSHNVHGIAFSRFSLRVPRLSGQEDAINVLLPSSLLETCPLTVGQPVEVTGEVRSFNNRSGVGNRLVITLFARTLVPTTEDPLNSVHLGGILCKPPILRRTPLGRDICDLLLAVNRKYRRADYLPCIAWGTLALFCGQLQVGDPLLLEGRLQSRIYWKTVGDQNIEHTAYEISIMSLDPPSEPE